MLTDIFSVFFIDKQTVYRLCKDWQNDCISDWDSQCKDCTVHEGLYSYDIFFTTSLDDRDSSVGVRNQGSALGWVAQPRNFRPNPNPECWTQNPDILKNWTQNPDDFEISTQNPA